MTAPAAILIFLGVVAFALAISIGATELVDRRKSHGRHGPI